jgi:hypothetical protein
MSEPQLRSSWSWVLIVGVPVVALVMFFTFVPILSCPYSFGFKFLDSGLLEPAKCPYCNEHGKTTLLTSCRWELSGRPRYVPVIP